MKLTSGMGAVLIAVFLAVSIVVSALIYQPQKTPVSITTGVVNDTRGVVASIADIDTDKDGLKDWEESLWGTDSLKADSDGDGTSDGKEVESGRNPKIPGPKDTLDIGTLKIVAGTPKTGTEEFGQVFLNEYFSARQGGEIDATKRDEIVSKVISKAGSFKTRIYTEGDLVMSADNSDTALRAYGNSMGEAIYLHAVKNENELVILQRALSTKRAKELEKLDPTISAYEGTLGDMLKIIVPTSALSTHLEILNATSVVLQSVKDFRGAFTDPIPALVSANNYLGNAGKLANAFRDATDWFKDKKVYFSEKESGRLFVNLLP
ncbi:MAG: hypothetical protein AAB597_01085 [Patescibacteria group bacterium]